MAQPQNNVKNPSNAVCPSNGQTQYTENYIQILAVSVCCV